MTRENYTPWDIEVLDELPQEKSRLLQHLVGWAVLAPNSHNVQPWKFIIRPKQSAIDICVDPEGILAHSDKKGRQAYISTGCAAANLLYAARFYGTSFSIEHFEGRPLYPDPVARIQFDLKRESEKTFYNLEALKSRKVNRGKFEVQKPIPGEVIEEIKQLAEESGFCADIVTDTPTRFAIAEIQSMADRYVIAKTDFRNELAEFLLPNNTQSAKGMPGNTFGLSDEMSEYIHAELKKEGAFDPDLAAGLAASSRDNIRTAPALVIISSPEDNPCYWFKAGIVLGSASVIAEVNGLGLSIHAALAEEEKLNKLLKLRLKRKERPLAIFRLGYAKEQRPHSPRLSAEEVSEIAS